MAVPDGDTLARGKAEPFVVNYQLVDTNGSISQAEFTDGCAKGVGFRSQRPSRTWKALRAGNSCL
jgi:hypothetical protein